MRVVVIGAGAIGALFGAKLYAAGNDVLLYDTWTEHVDMIRERGLTVEERDGSPVRYRVPATSDPPPAIAAAELILIQTKTYDTVNALSPLRSAIPGSAFVLSLQNGIGNYEAMQQALPDHERLIIGTTVHGSSLVGPGHIRHTGEGPTEIGDPKPDAGVRFDLQAIAAMFSAAGVEMTVTGNVQSAIWAKLAANVAINPLTALTGLRNGELRDDPGLVATYTAIVQELVQVMDALGIPRVKEDYVAYAEHVMEATAENFSSMLQDVRFKRRTEIEAINGAVARFGKEMGVATPVNEMVAALVRNRQRDYLEEGRGVF